MSDVKLISPMLDNFVMGDPISEHDGVRCCPAMENESDEKYIVKIVSTPASQTQVEALLLSGAYADNDAVAQYYKGIADGIIEETQTLQKLAQLEGFMPYDNFQIEAMDEGVGYDIYLLSRYRMTLSRYMQRNPMTHLGALNLGLDLCAALAVCRRMGYIYVNLKPDNVYLTDDLEYRIGDIGFIKLDSLKYASLPQRYRSAYTAPEIQDAYSALNETIDIYALGLILYQVFNNGPVPSIDEGYTELQPPTYADYEMSEIILKACAINPEDRYQNSIEFGQALVSYMQRNGAHDVPIVPQAVAEEVAEDVGVYEETDESESVAELEDKEQDIILEVEVVPTEADIYTEDEEGNLRFITEDSEDETAPDQEIVEVDYEEVTEEVSDILNQADELIAHPAPDPVVPPEAVEVTLPEVLPEQESGEEEHDACAEVSDTPSEDQAIESLENNAETVSTETTSAENEESSADTEQCDEPLEDASAVDEIDLAEEDALPSKKKGSKGWIVGIVIGVLVAALAVGGFFFYKNYFLQEIDSIVLETSDNGSLTVTVTADVDESKLTVICLDAYGNQIPAPVQDGKAIFTGLAPNSAYNIKVVIGGFHRLTGDTYASFTTPKETQIVQFQALTGAEDGSVILSFTAEGPASTEWTVQYSAANEETKEVVFSGSIVTLNNLTIGTEYTFTLTPNDDITLTGTNVAVYTASKIVKAENLFIMGRADGKLSVQWSAPSETTVNSWTVRCYDGNGYDQTSVVEQPNIVFEGVTDSAEYTVEVTAAGMSVSERAFVPADALNVTNYSIDNSDPNQLVVSWDSDSEVECILYYSIDGLAEQQVQCSNNTAVIDTVVPGAKYKLILKTDGGVAALGGSMIYQVPQAQPFDDYSVSSSEMEFMMCRTPSYSGWDRWDLSNSDYTTEFDIGENASFLVHLLGKYNISSDDIVILYVVRDSKGKLVSTAHQVDEWSELWYRNYGEFDIPALPQTPGQYAVEVYLNGGLAATQNFTMY